MTYTAYTGQKARLMAALCCLALVACRADKPPLLTAVDLEGAVGLFGVANPGPSVTWYKLLADGSFRPAATQGSRITVEFQTWTGAGTEAADFTQVYPYRMARVSPGLALMAMATLDRSDPRGSYLQHVMALDLGSGRIADAWPGADGSIGSYLVRAREEVPQRFVQLEPAGTFAVLPVSPASGSSLPSGPVRRASGDGTAWAEPWPLTPLYRNVSWFAVDAAGNLAIDGPTPGAPPSFIPAVGPMVESPATGTLGSFWAAHGAMHTTRAVGDAAGTIELIRFDFPPGGGVTATVSASWTGTGPLTGWPLAMGSATVFLDGTRPVVFDSLVAAPSVHAPLGITWSEVQATDNALWFSTTGAAPAGMARWTRAGLTIAWPADGWTYDELFPVSDDDVIIGARRLADSTGYILRSDGPPPPGLAPALDLGPSPRLLGHLRWK